MRTIHRVALTTFAVVACTGFCAPAYANHLPFSATLDRVEIDGNVFGAFDGTPDFVDEFEDGTIEPNWEQLRGSSTESSGGVTIHDPGTDLPYTPDTSVSLLEHVLDAENGAGDYTFTAYWTPALPALNQRFHVQLYGQVLQVEGAGISVTNLTPEVAADYSPPALAGYAISQELTHFGDSYGNLEIAQYDAVPVTPESITGPIVLRMSLNDAADQMTTSFSLDGGATFQSPFPPIPVFQFDIEDHDLLVGAAAVHSGPAPHPTNYIDLKSFEVKNTPQWRQVKYRARRWNIPLWDDPTVGGVSLNIALDGLTQCFVMPAAGWTLERFYPPKWQYRDRDRLYGPVREAQLKRVHRVVDAKVIVVGSAADVDLVPPNPGVQVDTNFEVGGLTDYCSSSAGGQIRANSATIFKTRDAPSPTACALRACGHD